MHTSTQLIAGDDDSKRFADRWDTMCRQTMRGARVDGTEYAGWCCLLRVGHTEPHYFSNPAWPPYPDGWDGPRVAPKAT